MFSIVATYWHVATIANKLESCQNDKKKQCLKRLKIAVLTHQNLFYVFRCCYSWFLSILAMCQVFFLDLAQVPQSNVVTLPKWQKSQKKNAKKSLKLLFCYMKMLSFLFLSILATCPPKKKSFCSNLPKCCRCPRNCSSWFGTRAKKLESCQKWS